MADSKLNEPGARYSRAEAMAMMGERRRETVAADMEPADHAAYVAGAPAPADPDTGSDAETNGQPAVARPAADERPQERSVWEIAAELEAKDPPATPPPQPKPQPGAPPPPPDPETVPEPLDLTRSVKLKVNGVEIERTLADVIADAQKVSAADEYLQRSRDQLHSINLLADEVRAKLKSDPVPTPVAPADTTQEDPIAAGVAALFRGDEEAATAALRKLQQPAAPAVDAAAITELVRQQIRQEQTLEQARAAFVAAHPDADTDPITAGAANSALRAELAKLGVQSVAELQPQQYRPVYEAAARTLSAWRTGHTTPAPTPAVNRTGKKAAIDELPAASARASTQEAPPQTNSSVIAAMRAARPGSAPSSVH